MIEARDIQLELMRHAVSDHNRNWFATSQNSKDCQEFEKLVAKGLATKSDAPSIWGDDFLFRLTEAGKEVVRINEPEPVKLTKGQKRYQTYLDCDSGQSFIEWLKDPHWNELRRMCGS